MILVNAKFVNCGKSYANLKNNSYYYSMLSKIYLAKIICKLVQYFSDYFYTHLIHFNENDFKSSCFSTFDTLFLLASEKD